LGCSVPLLDLHHQRLFIIFSLQAAVVGLLAVEAAAAWSPRPAL
jgi:hypothetical protein